MSGARVELTPEALREIDDAFEWYFERSLQAAEAFVRETTSAFALIASPPQKAAQILARTHTFA